MLFNKRYLRMILAAGKVKWDASESRSTFKVYTGRRKALSIEAKVSISNDLISFSSLEGENASLWCYR